MMRVFRYRLPTMVLVLLLSCNALAEYRVYQLSINDENGEIKRIVHSTLDQYQYPAYHPLLFGETISYVDSWMCRNRGDYFKKLCPSPKSQTDGKLRFPSSEGPDTVNN